MIKEGKEAKDSRRMIMGKVSLASMLQTTEVEVPWMIFVSDGEAALQ